MSDRRKFITLQLANRQTTTRLQFPAKNWTDEHERISRTLGVQFFKALMELERNDD